MSSKTEKIQTLANELGLSYSEAEIIINDSEPKEEPSKKLKVKRKKKNEPEIPQETPTETPKETPTEKPFQKIVVNGRISSEDIEKIMNITNPNILNLFFKTYLEETLKYESDQQFCLDIDYCIGLATDRYNQKFKKINEIKEQMSQKESQETQEETQEEKPDIETLRKMRLKNFS